MVEFLVLDVAWYFATVSIVWNLTRNTAFHWVVIAIVGVVLALLWMRATYHVMNMLTSGKQNNGSDDGILKKIISGFALIVVPFLMIKPFLITVYTIATIFHNQLGWVWITATLAAFPISFGVIFLVAIIIGFMSGIVGTKFPLVSQAIYERYHA